MPQAGENIFVRWAFHDSRYVEVIVLGDKVAYSWTCDPELIDHEHTIECLWVWHDCDLNLNPVDNHWTSRYVGWKPTGVRAHDLISTSPLHIEASVYWPGCCGLHGWIRDGKWVDAG